MNYIKVFANNEKELDTLEYIQSGSRNGIWH